MFLDTEKSNLLSKHFFSLAVNYINKYTYIHKINTQTDTHTHTLDRCRDCYHLVKMAQFVLK